MTPAEFRTLREACGLSNKEDASAYFDVARRTLEYWESGRSPIPAGAEAELLKLNNQIETGVQRVRILAADLASKHGAPDRIDLTRYRTADDYAGSRAALDGLPHPCHNALIGRTLVALRRDGIAAQVAYADPVV